MRTASLFGIILALVLAGCDREPPAKATPVPPAALSPAQSPAVSPATQPAPTAKNKAELPRVDLEGLHRLIAASSAKNEVLVIDFWATWCSPCVDLFPTLHEGVGKLGKGVRLTSVTLDSPGEFEDAALVFLDKQHARQDAYLMDPDTDKRLAVVDGLGKRWNNLVVPAILVYGRDGQLAYEFFERDNVDEMLAKIAKLNTAPSPADAASQPATPTP